MQITQVQVSVHEKRNHPYAYGHFDASVTLTADLDPGENHLDVIRQLRVDARDHAVGECDRWERDVHEQKRVDDLRISINSDLRQVRYVASFESASRYAELCQEKIAQLPASMQSQWQEKLEAALDEARAQIIKEDDVPDPDDDPDDDLEHDLCPHCHRVLDLETGLCPNCDDPF